MGSTVTMSESGLGVVTQSTTSPQMPASSIIIVTPVAPPPVQQEVVLARPSMQHQWVAGYWVWREDHYEWMAGHWVVPPQPNSVWVMPRWDREGSAYRFYEGYWK